MQSLIDLAACVLFACVCTTSSTILQNGNVTLILTETTNNGLLLSLIEGAITKLSGRIGVGLSLQSTDSPRNFSSSDIQLTVLDVDNGFNILWESSDTSQVIQDCFDFDEFDWFVGKEGAATEWPIQNSQINNTAYVVSTGGSIAEPYWLNSKGAFLFVNETTPLFVDQNNLLKNGLCFVAKIGAPYINRSKLLLNYTIAANQNAREVHRNAIDNYLGRPTGQPDTKMIREPIWSTWAKYQDDINDQLLLDLAQSIEANGFRGQVQIEDGWEECHGSLTFKKLQFAAINTTIMSINNFALRVTLWIHPFVSLDCQEIVNRGHDNGYFVKGSDGGDLITPSWNGNSAYLIDFTNEKARRWFAQRVELLLQKHVLDGFKFDAGEASWASPGAIFESGQDRVPNEITTDYNSITNLTTFVHVHSGWRTQWVPVFVSISEKEPNWSQENGLRAVVVNLIQLNLAGYTMVLPGLIGGKSLDRPSPELYVRWTQAVSLMPAMQFGYLPWEMISPSFDVLAIVQKCVDLHFWYSDKITNVMKKSKNMGLPVNAPVWWIDPTNPDAFKIVDQYMLGEDFLIAPVMTEGARVRDVYLPPGSWEDGNNATVYEGNRTIKNYPAPIDLLPYFIKQSD